MKKHNPNKDARRKKPKKAMTSARSALLSIATAMASLSAWCQVPEDCLQGAPREVYCEDFKNGLAGWDTETLYGSSAWRLAGSGVTADSSNVNGSESRLAMRESVKLPEGAILSFLAAGALVESEKAWAEYSASGDRWILVGPVMRGRYPRQRVAVDLDFLAGQSIRLRFVFREPWDFLPSFGFYLDDVRIGSPVLMSDGFESGDTSAWD